MAGKPSKPIRSLADLATLREAMAAEQREREQQAREAAAAAAKKRATEASFRHAMEKLDVQPLAARKRHHAPPELPQPQPVSRQRDDAEVLQSSLSDLDASTLLDTDESLSWHAAGVGPDVPRRLRRGAWSIQGEIDLHGHRVDEAREALSQFLKDAIKRNRRCVRVVHGKGLGSRGRTPVLKGKVMGWLRQREEVIAFSAAPAAEGGSGALLVLLRPTGNAGKEG
ncbi:MAG: Smr/MutS family protein [Burkholderiaceae bacterium]|nr:Smr/MutS family protein [Burkholderiaceae bacterium]